MEGRKSIFLSVSRSRFVAIGPAKISKNRSMNNVFMAKMNFEKGFCISEIIHDNRF